MRTERLTMESMIFISCYFITLLSKKKKKVCLLFLKAIPCKHSQEKEYILLFALCSDVS